MTTPVRLVVMAGYDDPVAMGMSQEDPQFMVSKWGWWPRRAAVRCDDDHSWSVMP